MNSDKIKVLQIIETLGRGGAEKVIVCALKNIDKDRFSPAVVCLFGETDMKEELEDADIPVYTVDMKSPYRFWSAIFNLYRLIKEKRFDIVHTHLFFANIYGRIASRLAGVRNVITTLHCPVYTYEDNGKFSFKIRKFIDKYSGKICNKHFLAVSNSVKIDYEKQLGYRNIQILHNCIDVGIFKRLDVHQIKRKRDELGFLDNNIVLLNVGRLSPEKGQICLIEALGILHKNNCNCTLIITGDGRMKNELFEKINSLGLKDSVIFLKNRKDIPEILNSCDIYVSPSVYEGFGIALVEAMANGMPVIASDIDAFKEIIQNNVDGIIVERENPEKLAKSISALIEDKRKRHFLGINAKKKALFMFDVHNYIKKLEHIYKELV